MGTKANTGIEVAIRLSRRRSTRLRAALQLVRTSRGELAYRFYQDGEWKDWEKPKRKWPDRNPVRLGFERANEIGDKWNLLVNGRVVKRGLEIRGMRGWEREAHIGVFGSAKIGTDWQLEVDDVKMVLRLKKP